MKPTADMSHCRYVVYFVRVTDAGAPQAKTGQNRIEFVLLGSEQVSNPGPRRSRVGRVQTSQRVGFLLCQDNNTGSDS